MTDREIKDSIIAAFVAEKKRQPSSEQVWVRFSAHPAVIARQATATLDLMAMKVQWQRMQLEQEKKQ
jgi:hypothetical protein